MAIERIVSCTPSTTDILSILSLTGKLIAADDVSASTLIYNDVESLGPVDNVNVHRIAELKPDLIIASDSVPGSEAIIDHLRHDNLPVMVLHTERFDDLLADIFSIGTECGVEEKAREVIDKLNAKIKMIYSQARVRDIPLRAYFEWFPNPFVSSGSQNWVTDMLKKSGAVNIFKEFPNPTLMPEEDEIIARDPEIIFICWIGQGDDLHDMEIEQIMNRKGWQDISAVKSKQIFYLPDSMFAFPGPKLLDGLELMVELVARCDTVL